MVKPGKLEVLDIDDTFCAAHGGQQLTFWNAHHDERGFASMHINHVTSGTPVAAILRPARTPKCQSALNRDPSYRLCLSSGAAALGGLLTSLMRDLLQTPSADHI